ncbi:MAG: hypothetical protein M3Q86_01080 [Verrucomicrobiota bacterium]|nr:hypothetical protein [Verrucomicrobiota bacterium]
MTSQVEYLNLMNTTLNTRPCQEPKNAPTEYCRKLKRGIARLERAIQTQYEATCPGARELIARAVQEAKEASWSTPFPSLFFPTLAHLKVREMIPSA